MNDKTYLLNSSFLNFINYNFKKIGIAEDNGINIYAVDVTDELFNLSDQGYPSLVEYDLRHLMSTLNEAEMNLVGRANQLLHWLKSNTHCGYCGSLKIFHEKEEAMFCKCNNIMTYPTISPCVLALIKKDNQILLARNALFPEGLYSSLAGFIEVSETAEETVKREVYEEAGLKVTNIKYFGSQSWPFPSQLMLAYTCEYESGEIQVDGHEIVDAKWFDIDNLPNTPPSSTLSGLLINSYISGH
ncbi:MAG: NAD(+) diphosphatase [Proteobacteria bacterium]|nr:NAD(+) diphosphatase [Pseudomonadota bacterium]